MIGQNDVCICVAMLWVADLPKDDYSGNGLEMLAENFKASVGLSEIPAVRIDKLLMRGRNWRSKNGRLDHSFHTRINFLNLSLTSLI